MKQRIITGLILAALALSVIYIGQTALTVGLLLVSLLGVYEIVKICHRPDWSYIVDVYCLAMSVWLFLGTQDFFIPAWQEMLFLIVRSSSYYLRRMAVIQELISRDI